MRMTDEEIFRQRVQRAIATLRYNIYDDLEDGPDYHRELVCLMGGLISHVLDILEGRE